MKNKVFENFEMQNFSSIPKGIIFQKKIGTFGKKSDFLRKNNPIQSPTKEKKLLKSSKNLKILKNPNFSSAAGTAKFSKFSPQHQIKSENSTNNPKNRIKFSKILKIPQKS
jgi:hypothetical protein